MIRLILYFACVAGVATGLAWVADRPGSVSVQWLGYDLKTSVFVGALVLMLVFAAVAAAIWLGILTWTAPKRIARYFERRKSRLGNEALRKGIFAAGAGDRLAALRAGAIAKRNIPNEPLVLLLEAQSAQLNEDTIASRQAFERMLEKPEMTELGLRGLYIEAKKAGELAAAKQFAERALASNPTLTWSSTALFDMQCRDGDWQSALRTLGIAKQNRHFSKAEADRRRAFLLTALAVDLEDTQQGKALAYALEAYGLMPSLTPAAVIAGRILAAQGNASRSTKLLTQAWRSTPHPELALIYAYARTGDAPRERLARVKTLVATGPQSLEGDIAVAVAAVEAKEWGTARSVLEPHLANNPPARICRLMARIEASENRDAGRAREWLAKASKGAPDPLWVASDGSVSTEWQPISPISGTLGAFEWKTPPTSAGETSNAIIAEISAIDVQTLEAETAPPAKTELKSTGESSTVIDVIPSQVDRLNQQADMNLPVPHSVDIPGRIRSTDSDFRKLEGDQLLLDEGVKPVVAGKTPAIARAAFSSKRKDDNRKPNIFVPGRAPDDPGPPATEVEEDSSTVLSRYRRPS